MEPLEQRVVERINRRREYIGEPPVRWEPRRAASALKRTTIGLPEYTSESYGLFIPVVEKGETPRYHGVIDLYGSIDQLAGAAARLATDYGSRTMISVTEIIDGVTTEEVLGNGTILRYAGLSANERRCFIRARNEAYQDLVGPSYGDRIVDYIREDGPRAPSLDPKSL